MRKDKRPISPNQSLLDLAVQHHGTVEAIAWLVKSGQFVTFTSATDSTNTFMRGEVTDERVVAELARMGISPTTGGGAVGGGGGGFSDGFSPGFETGQTGMGAYSNGFSNGFS